MIQLQITPPIEKKINESVTIRNYAFSHIFFEGQDLGSLNEIKNMRNCINEMESLVLFQARMISKLVNKDKLSIADKNYFNNFKRR